MPEIPEDDGDPSLFESTERYGANKASGRAWELLDRAESETDEAGSARRDIELAAIFYCEALFCCRNGGDDLPDLSALRERGKRLAEAADSDAARHLFKPDHWEPAEVPEPEAAGR